MRALTSVCGASLGCEINFQKVKGSFEFSNSVVSLPAGKLLAQKRNNKKCNLKYVKKS